MSGILSYVSVAGKLISSQPNTRTLRLPPVQVYPVEADLDRRTRCLKHLLKANHVSYSILDKKSILVNHLPHLLSAAYLLGASDAQLHFLYEQESKNLKSWTPSPAEIVDLDWWDFLGDKRYPRAYVDFFEDKLAMSFAYDWKREVEHFLFASEKPMFHGLLCGLGNPLVHLGYAYEMNCKEIAMEALGLVCVEHDFLCTILGNASYTKPSALASNSPLELLIKMSGDERFVILNKRPLCGEMEAIFNAHRDLIMEYWNAWEISRPLEQLRLSQEAAVALLMTNVGPGTQTYNFFFVHILTASHAVRVLLPLFPARYHISLVRQWWFLVVLVFVMQGRPWPGLDSIPENVGDKDWKFVQHEALASVWSKDANFVKAIRALSEASKTWGASQDIYLRAAVALIDGFDGWKSVPEELEI